DPGGRLTYVSPSLQGAAGLAPESVIGRPLVEGVHPEDAARVAGALGRAASQRGIAPALEFRFRHGDGSWRILEATLNNQLADAAKHLLELSNAILDLSKIEAGKMELYLESFSVASMVKDIVAIVQPLVGKNRNRMEVRCPDTTGTMRADLTKVRQSLFNLLSN